ncbi:hypothetical protein [Herbidospora mongoliensis]|uniref:hypothetical protein n=1 Tax=Herbidospora mongoliensis TaxID=688067 RepID=UPI000B15A81C|nr:hypothetical protein [Herbidospora mongoliensis]
MPLEIIQPGEVARGPVVDLPADLDEAIAVAAVMAWRGSAAFRVKDPAHTESIVQAVVMTEAIAGRRPPALARRGLA